MAAGATSLPPPFRFVFPGTLCRVVAVPSHGSACDGGEEPSDDGNCPKAGVTDFNAFVGQWLQGDAERCQWFNLLPTRADKLDEKTSQSPASSVGCFVLFEWDCVTDTDSERLVRRNVVCWWADGGLGRDGRPRTELDVAQGGVVLARGLDDIRHIECGDRIALELGSDSDRVNSRGIWQWLDKRVPICTCWGWVIVIRSVSGDDLVTRYGMLICGYGASGESDDESGIVAAGVFMFPNLSNDVLSMHPTGRLAAVERFGHEGVYVVPELRKPTAECAQGPPIVAGFCVSGTLWSWVKCQSACDKLVWVDGGGISLYDGRVRRCVRAACQGVRAALFGACVALRAIQQDERLLIFLGLRDGSVIALQEKVQQMMPPLLVLLGVVVRGKSASTSPIKCSTCSDDVGMAATVYDDENQHASVALLPCRVATGTMGDGRYVKCECGEQMVDTSVDDMPFNGTIVSSETPPLVRFSLRERRFRLGGPAVYIEIVWASDSSHNIGSANDGKVPLVVAATPQLITASIAGADALNTRPLRAIDVGHVTKGLLHVAVEAIFVVSRDVAVQLFGPVDGKKVQSDVVAVTYSGNVKERMDVGLVVAFPIHGVPLTATMGPDGSVCVGGWSPMHGAVHIEETGEKHLGLPFHVRMLPDRPSPYVALTPEGRIPSASPVGDPLGKRFVELAHGVGSGGDMLMVMYARALCGYGANAQDNFLLLKHAVKVQLSNMHISVGVDGVGGRADMSAMAEDQVIDVAVPFPHYHVVSDAHASHYADKPDYCVVKALEGQVIRATISLMRLWRYVCSFIPPDGQPKSFVAHLLEPVLSMMKRGDQGLWGPAIRDVGDSAHMVVGVSPLAYYAFIFSVWVVSPAANVLGCVSTPGGQVMPPAGGSHHVCRWMRGIWEYHDTGSMHELLMESARKHESKYANARRRLGPVLESAAIGEVSRHSLDALVAICGWPLIACSWTQRVSMQDTCISSLAASGRTSDALAVAIFCGRVDHVTKVLQLPEGSELFADDAFDVEVFDVRSGYEYVLRACWKRRLDEERRAADEFECNVCCPSREQLQSRLLDEMHNVLRDWNSHQATQSEDASDTTDVVTGLFVMACVIGIRECILGCCPNCKQPLGAEKVISRLGNACCAYASLCFGGAAQQAGVSVLDCCAATATLFSVVFSVSVTVVRENAPLQDDILWPDAAMELCHFVDHLLGLLLHGPVDRFLMLDAIALIGFVKIPPPEGKDGVEPGTESALHSGREWGTRSSFENGLMLDCLNDYLRASGDLASCALVQGLDPLVSSSSVATGPSGSRHFVGAYDQLLANLNLPMLRTKILQSLKASWKSYGATKPATSIAALDRKPPVFQIRCSNTACQRSKTHLSRNACEVCLHHSPVTCSVCSESISQQPRRIEDIPDSETSALNLLRRTPDGQRHLPTLGPWHLAWCTRCHHGGHAQHILAYLEHSSMCPVLGCNCMCLQRERVTLHSAGRTYVPRRIMGNMSGDTKKSPLVTKWQQ